MATVGCHNARGGQIGASFGGLLSHGATNNCKQGRQHLDPGGKLSQAEYALALQEQILARKAGQQLPGSDEEFQNLFGDRFSNQQARGMGQRNGGPMQPMKKNDYAMQLQEQIAARELQKEQQAADVASRPVALGLNFPAEAAAGGNGPPSARNGKRCGVAQMASKESYAQQLQQQMAERSQKKADDLAAARAVDGEWMPSAPTPTKGRRVGRPPLPGKEDYACQLKDQMMEKAAVARDQQRVAEATPSHLGLAFGGQDASSIARGRRVGGTIEYDSRRAYNSFLQEQMSEKSANKAANAHHLQPQGADNEGDGRGEIFAGDRGKKAVAIKGAEPSKEEGRAIKGDYALALQDQIANRQIAMAAQKALDNDIGEARFAREAASDAKARGRRHCSVGPVLDRKALGTELRDQMYERDSKKAADAFHMQPVSNGTSEARIVPRAASEGPSKGRRHVQPAGEPPSNPFSHMMNHGAPPRMPPPAQSRVSPVPPEASAASKPPAYGSKFARGGASLLGLDSAAAAAPSVSRAYQDPRIAEGMDYGYGAPAADYGYAAADFDEDAHERAMIERLVAMRDLVKNDPSSTQDPRRVSFKGGYNAEEENDTRSKMVNQRTESLKNLLLND